MVSPRITKGAEYFLKRLQNKLETHNMLCASWDSRACANLLAS